MSPKRVSGKRNSLQRVQLAALPPAAPAQLAIELTPPDCYRSPAAAPTPSWRTEAPFAAADHRDATSGRPAGSSVIEIDLT